jgi:hypothetical protein
MTKRNEFENIKNYFLDFGYIINADQKYENSFSEMGFVDNDGYKYFLSYGAFKAATRKGNYPCKFSSRNPHSIENIKLWIDINGYPFSYVSGDFIDAHEINLCFNCNICGENWITCWNYIETGRFCSSKKCLRFRATKRGREKFLTKEHNLLSEFPDLSLEWDYSKNEFLPSEITPKSDYRAYWICSICGYNWPAKIHNRTNGTGCPVCKLSRGERRIESCLKKKNISYDPQHCFIDCRGEKYSLPFDFYLPDYNCCIEYQGEQHYGVLRNEFFGGEESLKKRQVRDSIKEEYCRRNGIYLLIIPYWNFDSIENVLDNYFI